MSWNELMWGGMRSYGKLFKLVSSRQEGESGMRGSEGYHVERGM